VRFRAGQVAVLALVTILIAACGESPCHFGAPAEFVSLGKNPFAVTQPTPTGRRLHTLKGWRGEVYTGISDMENIDIGTSLGLCGPRAGRASPDARRALR
jgi:hypothetical protein